jgi:acyl phosphate:glycerol-3-phosphate acyltransferase
MTTEAQLALLAAAAYLLGSIPFGLIVGKAKGVDPRQHGSGNIGATNLGRILGGKYFALVFTLDLLKGLIPMLIGAWLVRHADLTHKPYLMWMLVGAGAILGHLFPLYLKFKGGKGVATGAGVLLGLFPYYTYPGLAAIAVFLIVFLISRMVSLGSILAAAAFPALYVLAGAIFAWPVFDQQLPLLIFAVLMASLIVFKHRTNMARILNGTEHAFKKKPGSTSIEKMSPPPPLDP